MDLSLYNNDWYKQKIGASLLKQILWYLINGIFFINPLNPFSGLKCFLLRLFGAQIGKNVVIKPGVNIKYPWKLIAGNHVWIGENVWIDNLATIRIGNHVVISQGALLLTGNHNYKKTGFDLVVKEILIQDGVWLGAKSIICPGVTVGTQSVIVVGAVLTDDAQPSGVYGGNPAVYLKERRMEASD